jgi:hypothetical protein
MKTHPPPSSTQPHNGPRIGRRASHNWKRRFRLNALELNPLLRDTTTEAQPWVCDEPQLMRLLQVVSDEVASLNALLRAAGEPVLPCGPADLMHLLGVASVSKPDTWRSKLRFSVQLLIGLARLVNLTSSARLELAIRQPAVR